MAHILVIDDDDALRQMLRAMIWAMGHTVAEAAEGAEARAVFTQTQTDVIVTDLLMDGQDGFQTIGYFRKHHPAAKIIAMTGGGSIEPATYLHVAQSLGAHSVLAKPFSQEAFQQALSDVLNS